MATLPINQNKVSLLLTLNKFNVHEMFLLPNMSPNVLAW